MVVSCQQGSGLSSIYHQSHGSDRGKNLSLDQQSCSPSSSNVLAVEKGARVISQGINFYTNHFLLSRKLFPVRQVRQFLKSQLWVYLEVGLMTCDFSASRIFQVYFLDQASLLLLPSSCVSKSSRNSPHKISVTVQFYTCLCADIMHSFNLKISSPSFPYFLQLLL